MPSEPGIPIIDVSALVSGEGDTQAVSEDIGRACRRDGFFYVTEHGIEERLARRLERLSREFFARDLDAKMAVRMELGGRAWRGYFPVGGELTAGRPDQKEGLYFGAELGPGNPRVAAGVPLHGPNLFPDLPGFREAVLGYMDALSGLGHAVMEGIALSLDLERSYFHDRYTAEPLILFRIFHYPARPATSGAEDETTWGVGEHTDYGLLTLLRQDDAGGLQVRSQDRWIDAPPVSGSIVCNIGDMLERMTGGTYRSTPHRVRNLSGRGRLSMPFFFDPDFDAEVRPIDPGRLVSDDHAQRWDRQSVHDLTGTYGEYVLRKVSHVFPDLGRTVL